MEVPKFEDCFKYAKQELYSKLEKERNLRKVAELFYAFLTTPDEMENFVELFDKLKTKIPMHLRSSDDCK